MVAVGRDWVSSPFRSAMLPAPPVPSAGGVGGPRRGGPGIADESFPLSPPLTSRTHQASPSGVENVGVRTLDDLPPKEPLGPLPREARFAVSVSDDRTSGYVLEVRYKDGAIVSATDQSATWMTCIQSARDRHEQNVEAFKDARGLVRVRTVREIKRGEELYLWFSEDLAREENIPALTPANIRGDQQYQCTFCLKSYRYPNTLKSHIKYHCPQANATLASCNTAISPLNDVTPPPLVNRVTGINRSMHLPNFTHPLKLDIGGHHHHHHHHHHHSGLTTAQNHFPHGHHHQISSHFAAERYAIAKQLVSPFLLRPMSQSPIAAPTVSPSGPSSKSPVFNLGSASMSAFKPHKRSPGGNSKTAYDDREEEKNDKLSIKREIKSEITGEKVVSKTDEYEKDDKKVSIITGDEEKLSPKQRLDAYRETKKQYDDHQNRQVSPQSHPHHHHHHPHSHQHPHLPSHPMPQFHMNPSSLSYMYPYYPAMRNNMTRFCCGSGSLPTSPNAALYNRKLALGVPMYYAYNVTKQTTAGLSSLPPQNDRHVNTDMQPKDNPDKLSPHLGPFKFPLPSEKAGEPLDLLPRSLYINKSRKGHLCIYCGKLYSRKYGLKIHLRTHTGYKPLKCKVCLRPFGDPSNLNKHIRLHAEGDTPYRCEFCGKVLVRRRDLERHVKSRHPNEMLKLDNDVITAKVNEQSSESCPGGKLIESAEDSDSACSDLEIDDCDDSVTDIEVA